MVLEPRKDALCNFIIVSLAVPLRHHPASCRVSGSGVAFAEVNAKCDSGKALNHGVVGRD